MSPESTPVPTLLTVPDPSWFDWLADIVIPGLLGAVTVIVAIVAVTTSHRATALAHAVEVEREKSESARAQEQRRLRVQGMAIEEARVLQRWVVEMDGARMRWRTPGEYDMSRSESEQAGIDAHVALTQSIVPGAADLLQITAFDIDNKWTFLKHVTGESDAQKKRRTKIAGARSARTSARIRRWALDPESQAPHIAGELITVDDDPRGYLLFGEDPITDE